MNPYGYRFLPLIGLPLSFYFAALVVGLIFEEGSPTADPDGLKTYDDINDDDDTRNM